MLRKAKGEKVEDLAKQFSVARSTLYYRIAIFNNENRLTRKKVRRKPKVSQQVMQSLRIFLDKNPFATLSEIKQTLKLNVVFSTITKYLQAAGISRHIAPMKFFINRADCEERFEVARRRAS